MRIALALLLPASLALHGCSSSYQVYATIVGGRLAFEAGEGGPDCIATIHVSSARALPAVPPGGDDKDLMKRGAAYVRAHAAWATDGVTYACTADFPVVYGQTLEGVTLVVAPKKLEIGVPYAVSVSGPNASGGNGCFRINPDRRPENLPDNDCWYTDPRPTPPPEDIARAPIPRVDPALSLPPADYPAAALRAKKQGTVRVSIDVSAEGQPTRCVVVRSSGTRALDDATCPIMLARASFTPAIDKTSSPAAATTEQDFRWTLPEARPTIVTVRTQHDGAQGGMAVTSVSSAPAQTVSLPAPPVQPIDARPPPDQSGPAAMFLVREYGGIGRRLGRYTSLAACEDARTKRARHDKRATLCGLDRKSWFH
jgi:TonB family protein